MLRNHTITSKAKIVEEVIIDKRIILGLKCDLKP